MAFSSKKWKLIAGFLCDILIVVEASIKSGTSGTVDEALALGKDVCRAWKNS